MSAAIQESLKDCYEIGGGEVNILYFFFIIMYKNVKKIHCMNRKVAVF